MIEALELIGQFILMQFKQIWLLYVGGSVISLTLVLWLLDHFFHIFDVIRGK